MATETGGHRSFAVRELQPGHTHRAEAISHQLAVEEEAVEEAQHLGRGRASSSRARLRRAIRVIPMIAAASGPLPHTSPIARYQTSPSPNTS